MTDDKSRISCASVDLVDVRVNINRDVKPFFFYFTFILNKVQLKRVAVNDRLHA